MDTEPESKADNTNFAGASVPATSPKDSPPSFEAAMAKLSIENESFHCVSQDSGEKILIKKNIVKKIPYFEAFFRSELGDGEPDIAFKPPVKNEAEEYILPAEIEFQYLKPILAYLESDCPMDLFTKLSIRCDVWRLIALFDFLLIKKPEIDDDDLDSIRTRMTEDIKDYDDKICRRVYEFHSARYGRRDARMAAGELCAGLAMGIFNLSDHRNRQKIFSRVQFILSHPRTFRIRLRRHTKAISDVVLAPRLTAKQQQMLDTWCDKFAICERRNLDSDSDPGSCTDPSLSDDQRDNDYYDSSD